MTAEPSSGLDPLAPFVVGDDEPDAFVDYRLGIADLRRHLGEVVARAAYADRCAVITRNGRPAAALVPVAALAVLERVLEDRDARLARSPLTGHRREVHR